MKLIPLALKITFFTLLAACLAAIFLPVEQYLEPELPPTEVKLVDISDESGLDFTHADELYSLFRHLPHVTHLGRWLESISASVSVVDINKDGLYDVFLTSTQIGSASKFFINQGNNKFVDKAADYNLSSLITAARSVFFDCDNDKTMEVLITAHTQNKVMKMDKYGKFRDKVVLTFSKDAQLSTAVNVFDFNRDGNLDIIVNGFGHLNVPESLVSARNGSEMRLFEGKGSCEFEDVTEKLNFGRNFFAHAFAVVDLWNRGNKLDLWMATDFNEDHIFEQQDNYEYKDVSYLKSKSQSQSGMAAEAYYENNSPYPSIYVSHVFKTGYVTDGNKIWNWDPKNKMYFNNAREMGVNRCGWAWGGASLDIENDGDPDLLVANGFVSGDSTKNWWFVFQTTMNSARPLVGTPKHWPDMRNLNMSGHEQDCLFINDGKHRYRDYSKALNFDVDKRDGRGIARIDSDNDGLIDLVVANQKQKAYFYHNQSSGNYNWIGFELEATKSQWQALGAKLILTLEDGTVMRKIYYYMNGYAAEHDPRAVFGMGRQKPKSLVIEWPSGNQTTITDLQTNKYQRIVEP